MLERKEQLWLLKESERIEEDKLMEKESCRSEKEEQLRHIKRVKDSIYTKS